MAYQEIFEDKLTEGTMLWRYIPLDRFIQLLDTDMVYLPTAANYEDTDLNEGRFTQQYVDVVRRWVRGTGPSDITEEEEIEIALSKLLAGREGSYISCWTYRDGEDSHMWQTFGDEMKGVALRTTLGKLCDDFYEYCEQNEPFDLSMGLIEYNRQNMHLYLSGENIFNYHLPLFFLDGGDKSFRHEQECRLVLYNPMELEDIAAEFLTDGLVASEGTVKLKEKFRKRVSKQENKGLLVPINLENLLLEVVFGPKMTDEEKSFIKSKTSAKGISINYQDSALIHKV